MNYSYFAILDGPDFTSIISYYTFHQSKSVCLTNLKFKKFSRLKQAQSPTFTMPDDPADI